MMKKIFNWTFGGFFRTIGRVLAFLVIGGLIGYIAFKNDIKITDLLGITKVSALEISTSSIDYVNLTGYGGSEVNIVGSSYKTISTGQMHFSLKYHSYINYTSNELPYTSILVVCANNTPIRTGQNNYTNVMSDASQTMTAGASCLLDNQTTGTLYYLPLGKQNIAPNSQCASPCNHFNDWSYTIASNSKIKFSSLMVFNEEDYLLFKNNVATIGKIDEEAQAIIDAQNQNTTDIIDSLGNLGQDIVDNANQNAQNIINSQKVCQTIDKNNIEIDNVQLMQTGGTTSNNNTGVTGYIKIVNKTIKELYVNGNEGYLNRFCFYDVNKTKLSCEENAYVNDITIPQNAYYFRSTIVKSINKPSYQICANGNQATTDAVNDLNDNLNNSDTSEAINDASNLFTNFTTNNHGLTGVISAPLTLIRNLASNTCSTLTLPLPFVDENLTLPCLSSIYQQHFPTFLTMYQVIISAIIGYKICISVFFMVKGFKDPGEDKIEVLDL